MGSARVLSLGMVVQVLRRYHVQDREEYKKYNRLCGMVTKLTSLLYRLDPTDEDRIKVTSDLLDKYGASSALCVHQSLVQQAFRTSNVPQAALPAIAGTGPCNTTLPHETMHLELFLRTGQVNALSGACAAFALALTTPQ